MSAPNRRGFLAGHHQPGGLEPAQRRSSGCGVEAGSVSDRCFRGAAWPQAQHRQDGPLAGFGSSIRAGPGRRRCGQHRQDGPLAGFGSFSRRSGGRGDRRHGGGAGHSAESSWHWRRRRQQHSVTRHSSGSQCLRAAEAAGAVIADMAVGPATAPRVVGVDSQFEGVGQLSPRARATALGGDGKTRRAVIGCIGLGLRGCGGCGPSVCSGVGCRWCGRLRRSLRAGRCRRRGR